MEAALGRAGGPGKPSLLIKSKAEGHMTAPKRKEVLGFQSYQLGPGWADLLRGGERDSKERSPYSNVEGGAEHADMDWREVANIAPSALGLAEP